MRYPFKPCFSRAMSLLGLLGLGFVQVGCAHQVVVEPSVVVHSRVSHVPVYAHVGLPGAVIYRQPQVIYAPPLYRQAPAWGYGQEHRRRWGHDRHEEGRGEHGYGRRGHGERDDWRR